MKKLIFLLMVFSLPALAYAQPSIKFDTETYDFGEVAKGASLEYSFEFVNLGTEDLLIERITPS